jgi:hypothetical protein
MYLPSCDACLACGLGDYFGWVAVQLLLLECDAESSSASIAPALEKDRKERTRRAEGIGNMKRGKKLWTFMR